MLLVIRGRAAGCMVDLAQLLLCSVAHGRRPEQQAQGTCDDCAEHRRQDNFSLAARVTCRAVVVHRAVCALAQEAVRALKALLARSVHITRAARVAAARCIGASADIG
eukprot:1594274-Prymnesium_polylepis.3